MTLLLFVFQHVLLPIIYYVFVATTSSASHATLAESTAVDENPSLPCNASCHGLVNWCVNVIDTQLFRKEKTIRWPGVKAKGNKNTLHRRIEHGISWIDRDWPRY